ncbi:MAG: hypothetical protein Q7S37_00915 [bacterium]|nr:hypothetical protein [bacterium]
MAIQSTAGQSEQLSPEIEALLTSFETEDIEPENQDSPKIHINMATGTAALIYEKIRNTIGYQEEKTLRRLAISRMLARRAVFDKGEKTIATGLIWELIQSGYLKNDQVPEEKIAQIENTLRQFSALGKFLPPAWSEYFFGIVGCQVETILTDYNSDEALVMAFHSLILRQFYQDKEPAEHEKISELLYYSLVQLFFKLDKPALRHYALRYKIPDWESLTSAQILDMKNRLIKEIQQIEDNLKILPESRFPKISKRYYPIYMVLQKIIHKDPSQLREIITNKQKLAASIKQIASEYFTDTLAKLNRSILKAVLFIFTTKVILGLIFEIPYDRYYHGHISYVPLLINIIFPPLLMYLSVSMISVPGANNARKIITIAKKFIYNEKLDENEKQKYGYILTRSKTLQTLLNTYYALTFIMTLIGVIWLLRVLKFNLISGILFFLFLSIVSFLAFRIRRSATDLVVVEERENTFVTILDFLLLPFLKIGFWLSKKFEKANILVLIFDFILEAPFKTILEAIEHWIAFVREKKEEIVS